MNKATRLLYKYKKGAEYIYYDGIIVGVFHRMRNEITRPQYFGSYLYYSASNELTIHNFCYRSSDKQDVINKILSFHYELSQLKSYVQSLENDYYRNSYLVAPNYTLGLRLREQIKEVRKELKDMNLGYYL